VVRELKRKNNNNLKDRSWYWFVDVESKSQEDTTKKVSKHGDQPYKLDHTSDVYLTRREMQCVACLVRGKTQKKTALLLGISVRTVQSYCDAVRRKLNCVNSQQLITVIQKSDLMKKIPDSMNDIMNL